MINIINLFIKSELKYNYIIKNIKYYNYCTVPSGKEFNLNELSNRDYLVLLKFLNGENLKGFYNTLDLLLKDSIPDFDSLDICDKAYIYIAFYFYSVKSSISLKGEKFDSVEVPLTILLDSLEHGYKKDHIKCSFHNWSADVHYPTKLIFDDNNTILIDYLSSLRSVAGVQINAENLEQLRAQTPTKILGDLEHDVKSNLSYNVDISKNIPNSVNISDNILNPALFHSISYIYKDLLENFYNMQYLMTHYIKVSWDSLLDMTPIESTILFNNFKEDKERQNEAAKSKTPTSKFNSF